MRKNALLRTGNGQVALNEKSYAEFVPYTRHVDPHTVATKDGYLLQIIKLEGFSFETADQDLINLLKLQRNNVLRGLGTSQNALYYHIHRHKVDYYPDYPFTGFLKELDDTWRAKLSSKSLYVNDHYLTVVRRDYTGGTLGLADSFKSLLSQKFDQQQFLLQQQERLKKLNEASNSLLSSLRRYTPELLGTYTENNVEYSQVLEFLSFLINGKHQKIKTPNQALDTYLPSMRILFGNEQIEFRDITKNQFGAMISIKEYDASTYPGMLDDMLRVPHEFLISQSFAFINKPTALDHIKRTERIMDNAEDEALSLRAELEDAKDDLVSGRLHIGSHHLSIFCKEESKRKLDDTLTALTTAVGDLGVIGVREDSFLEGTYWSQLPGNFSFIKRDCPITTKNFASYASFHNYPSGKREKNHWGQCVTILETTSGTPYHFNFHLHDLGNMVIVGPSGTGKTVVLTFLMAQAQRFQPRSIFFDKDRGAEIFIRAIGGRYSVMRPGYPSGMNPLQLGDTPGNRSFIIKWLRQLAIRPDGIALSTDEEKILKKAVDANYQVPKDKRKLSVLAELFRGQAIQESESLSKRMEKWHGKGEHAWLFDNDQDTLKFDRQTTGFDLTFLLDDDITRPAAFMYLFHRTDAMLSGDPAIIFIDEVWKPLKDKVAADEIENWERVIRKRGGLIALGSQSAKSIMKSSIGDVIVEQSPTKLFMPNRDADKESYVDGFGLSNKELQLIREMPDDSRCFIVKHGNDTVVAKLDLHNQDDLLAVLSGREDTVELLDRIREEFGDQPDIMLKEFHRARKQKKQATA